MSTSFKILYNTLDGRLNDSEITYLDGTSKRKNYLINAIPDFEDYFRILTIDENNETITEDLTAKEKKLLALFMVREYYRQEKVKYSKIFGIVTDSTKISNVADVKKALQDNLNEIEVEINQLLATLV